MVENLKFVSDPMLFGRHIVELNGTNNTLVRSYAWGLDLSASLSGAGGVGGLAWVTLHTASGPASGTHFTCYDGNGNIVALVSATTSDVTARYEYGPFGEPIRVTGTAANQNSFRFSTKRTDSTADLVLYEYRVYQSSTGRWPNRDPLGELGFELLRRGRPSLQGNGPNPYHFVGNNPISIFDVFGLYDNCCCDANMIDRTRRILVGRYAAAESYLNPHRPLIMPEEGSWSCLNVAWNVGKFMKPIPPCWTCYVENRRGPYKFEPFVGWVSHDLNVVVCVSHPKSGKPQKIVFDYWHHASPGEDYSVFAGNYPYSGSVDPSFAEGDCSKPIPHWTPKYEYLDLIIDRPPPTNAPEWPNVPL